MGVDKDKIVRYDDEGKTGEKRERKGKERTKQTNKHTFVRKGVIIDYFNLTFALFISGNQKKKRKNKFAAFILLETVNKKERKKRSCCCSRPTYVLLRRTIVHIIIIIYSLGCCS